MTRLLEAPAGLREFDNDLRQAWQDYLHTQFQLEIGYIDKRYHPERRPDAAPEQVQFADPTTDAQPATAQLHAVSWGGFPRKLLISERDGELVALLTAEQLQDDRGLLYTEQGEPLEVRYRQGDEYCEWRAESENGRLRRVTFTCLPPDYVSLLAQGYPSPFFILPGDDEPPVAPSDPAGRLDYVLEHYYQRLVSADVAAKDLLFDQDVYDDAPPKPHARSKRKLLFRAGEYNPWNHWNVEDGIVHLSHPANTLGEEIELIGDATVLRKSASGEFLQAAKCLLCCGGYGDINRSSDPAIGAAVNELARAGFTVTIADPIGLYMSHLEDSGWTKPDGTPVPRSYWQVTDVQEGTPGLAGSARTVRAVYEVPEGEYFDDHGVARPLQVGDLRIGGEPIRYAGQIAKAVRMVLVVAAWKPDGRKSYRPEPILCESNYRCCRQKDGGESMLLRQVQSEKARAPRCPPGYSDAIAVARESADKRYRERARRARGGRPSRPSRRLSKG